MDRPSVLGVFLHHLEIAMSVQDVLDHVVVTPVLLYGDVVLCRIRFSIHWEYKEFSRVSLNQVLSTGQQGPIDLPPHQVASQTSGHLQTHPA